MIKYFYGDDDNPVPVVQCFTNVENSDKSNNDNPVSADLLFNVVLMLKILMKVKKEVTK